MWQMGEALWIISGTIHPSFCLVEVLFNTPDGFRSNLISLNGANPEASTLHQYFLSVVVR